jgi:hypothetical protein
MTPSNLYTFAYGLRAQAVQGISKQRHYQIAILGKLLEPAQIQITYEWNPYLEKIKTIDRKETRTGSGSGGGLGAMTSHNSKVGAGTQRKREESKGRRRVRRQDGNHGSEKPRVRRR